VCVRQRGRSADTQRPACWGRTTLNRLRLGARTASGQIYQRRNRWACPIRARMEPYRPRITAANSAHCVRLQFARGLGVRILSLGCVVRTVMRRPAKPAEVHGCLKCARIARPRARTDRQCAARAIATTAIWGTALMRQRLFYPRRRVPASLLAGTTSATTHQSSAYAGAGMSVGMRC
jgi:hypothetical protein